MNIKQFIEQFKKGYHRQVTLPLWKLIIIYCIWILSIIGYIAAIYISLYFIIVGILFQNIALSLHIKWDTSSGRDRRIERRN